MGLWFRIWSEEAFHVTACNFIATLSLRSKTFKWVLKGSWISQEESVTLLKLVGLTLLCYTCGFGKLSNFSSAGSGRYQNQAVSLFMVWWLMLSPLPETLPCFLFFLVINLAVPLCHENITGFWWLKAFVWYCWFLELKLSRISVKDLKNTCHKRPLKPFYHLLWHNLGGIERVALMLASLRALCAIKQEKCSFQQVNLLFHQSPQDHLRPFQLLLHLLTWASQKRVAPIKIARSPLPSGQKGSLEFGREDLSLLRP